MVSFNVHCTFIRDLTKKKLSSCQHFSSTQLIFLDKKIRTIKVSAKFLATIFVIPLSFTFFYCDWCLKAYRCINDKTFDPFCLIFAGLLQVVDNCFSDLGVKKRKKSTIGFGADGASVNLGKRRGVASLLKHEVDHLIDIHCLPHRLELSMMEMQQECKYVKEV